MLTIGQEPLARFWPEAETLMRAHCEEVRACPADEFCFDLAQAQALEAANALVIYAVRENGRMVGYCVWYLSLSIINLGQSVALQSGWYVEPARREGALALHLFRSSLAKLRELGVDECFPHFWQDSPPRLSDFFKRLGARPAEIVYRMKL